MDINWVVAATAPNEFTATLWRDILVDGGIQAFIKPSEAATFLVASAILPVRVMVPKARLTEARALLADVEIADRPNEPADE
jgi:hypothetical protein